MTITKGDRVFLSDMLLAVTAEKNTNCHGICVNEKD